MPLDLRTCDPIADRAACHAILRSLLLRGPVPFSIHPGEWDWWCFHRDPEAPGPLLLIGDGVLVDFEPAAGELAVFGATPEQLREVVAELGAVVQKVGCISSLDLPRIAALHTAGFVVELAAAPLFRRETALPVDNRGDLPREFAIRPLAGEAEIASRSSAARRAFRTAMEPDQHVARYRAFTRSPAYDPNRDLVVFDERNGRVAAFAIAWPDAETSLAQFEPVGTDPDYVRRGFARAVIAESLDQLARLGIANARVTTNEENDAAIALYLACGFDLVDEILTLRRPRPPD